MERWTQDKLLLTQLAERKKEVYYHDVTPPPEVVPVVNKYGDGTLFVCRVWDRQVVYVQHMGINYTNFLS